MNFLLRDRLGILNRTINEKILEIAEKKESIIHELRKLHKSPLMNPDIPQREIQIMEGNRENYIKRISHFVTNIDVSKNYLETYDYSIKFSSDMEQLSKEVQKNVFVLGHFFNNEINTISKDLNKLEALIIDIRITFEKNNVEILKDIQDKIKLMTKNIVKIQNLDSEISEQKTYMKEHDEKLKKLSERIQTIITGTDYRTLESFKEEKSKVEEEIKSRYQGFDHALSEIETALKKYFYKNQDKKILRDYFDDAKTALINDTNMEFASIITELKSGVESGMIELKDKKKESTIDALNLLTLEYIKNLSADIKKLDSSRQHIQTKITHNSASLNLSEQQYWINATEDKKKQHQTNIDKLSKDIEKLDLDNNQLKESIKEGLEKVMDKEILIKDDLKEHLEKPIVAEEDTDAEYN